MVAQAKHRKRVKPEKRRRISKAPATRKLLPVAPKKADGEVAPPEEEPRPEDLAREVPIKPEELEEAAAIPEEDSETSSGGRERERSGYDGDTAIKLYLRRDRPGKLLTPQQEIELAARIKKGDKKARELMIKAKPAAGRQDRPPTMKGIGCRCWT